MNTLDACICSFDAALRTLAAPAAGRRPMPVAQPQSGSVEAPAHSQHSSPSPLSQQPPLTVEDQRRSGALMRVNHVGEVCAQALYQAQALTARTPQLREQMQAAAAEETDHLAWTQQRLRELGAHQSVLNPLWYAGAFAIGLAAGRLSDKTSLGFVLETERQVEQHLAGHLQRLPTADVRSRAIVAQMQADEQAHADWAAEAGAQALPPPVRGLMRMAAKVMTTTAHYL